MSRPRQPAPDQRTMVHQLRVQQVELEMQNEELHEANLQLEQAVRHFQELYDFGPAGYLSMDPRGVILESNLAAAEMLGRPRAEILGRSLYLLLPRKQRDDLHRHLRAALAGRRATVCVLGLKLPDGSARYLRLQSLRHRGSTESPVCHSVAVDITATMVLHEELVAAKELNQSIVGSIEDSVVVLDQRLRVVSANPSFFKLSGADPSSIEGVSIWRLGGGRWYGPELRNHLEVMSAGGKAFSGLAVSAKFSRTGSPATWRSERGISRMPPMEIGAFLC